MPTVESVVGWIRSESRPASGPIAMRAIHNVWFSAGPHNLADFVHAVRGDGTLGARRRMRCSNAAGDGCERGGAHRRGRFWHRRTALAPGAVATGVGAGRPSNHLMRIIFRHRARGNNSTRDS